MTSDPLSKARSAWGPQMPDWVGLLAEASAASSQNQVAKRLGVSATLVSNVLAARYTGDMERIEDIVRGIYDRKVVQCPAVGEMASDQCRKWRAKASKKSTTSAMTVIMRRACNRCPIHTGGGDE